MLEAVLNGANKSDFEKPVQAQIPDDTYKVEPPKTALLCTFLLTASRRTQPTFALQIHLIHLNVPPRRHSSGTPRALSCMKKSLEMLAFETRTKYSMMRTTQRVPDG